MPRRRVAIAVAVVLVAGIVVLVTKSSDNESSDKTNKESPNRVTPRSSAVTTPTAPAPIPVTGSGADNLATLDGHARSVETTGAAVDLASVHLTGNPLATSQGRVVDHNGVDHGYGSLTARGPDLTVSAPGLTLQSRLRIQPASVTLNGGALIGWQGDATITAARITFQPTATTTATSSNANSTTTVPPVTLAGPVTLSSTSVTVGTGALRWTDVPTTVHTVSTEADYSWAGPGSIVLATGPVRAGFLGVRGQQLDVSAYRSASAVDLHGTALALQVFADGVPQIRTPARIDVLGTHATTGFLGRRHAFVWTPRNLGSTYDMAILAIHPGNQAAGGVHLGLLPMPPMFGGEPHALVGGDTGGLKGGTAIDSLIARNGDDKRSIGYDAAAGVNLVLIVQGNFDTITVTVPTY